MNIPPLLVPRQFGDDELVETRHIASLHVYVGQAMERIKNSPNTHYFLGSEGHSSHWDIHWLKNITNSSIFFLVTAFRPPCRGLLQVK